MLESNFEIRSWNEKDDISKITNLLHMAYRPLADQGLRYLASYQDDEETLKRLGKGKSFLLLQTGEIVGTISLVPPVSGTDCELLNRSDVIVLTQFAIFPTLQKSGMGSKLLKYVEEYAAQNGYRHIVCDTAENAADLIAYYSKRGYNFIDFVKWNHTNYRSVILAKEL